MSWQKPAECTGCPLFEAPGPVFGIGDPLHAKIIYIAQNPARHEVEARPMQPLVGPSGNVLNYQLGQVGLRRDELFLTNQVKCRTPNDREPTAAEVRHCKPFLDRELARCKADTVILAGALAFKENVGSYSTLSTQYKPSISIFERMGCVEQREGKKWIGTIHPAFVMRMPEWKEAANDHLRKAQLVAGLDIPKPKIIEHPSDAQIFSLIDHIMLESREFSDDVETIGLEEVEEDDYCGADFQLTMCGVGGRPYEALVLDPDKIHLLAPIFADSTVWRYEHNGPYDNYHLEKIFGVEGMQAKCFDTMLGTHYLRSFAPKKLKPYVVSQYTNLPYYNRDLGKVGMKLYNGMDVITTFLAAKEQRRQMERWGLTDIFFEFGQSLLPVLEEIRRKGVNVNLHKALLFKRITQSKIDKAQILIAKVTSPLFNPNSHPQVKEMLYARLQLPVQYKQAGRERKVTTDFEARKRLRWWIESSAERREKYKAAYILLQLLDFISGETKKIEYIDRISGDGRLHPYYKAHGASSFRLSSKPNLQNFPVYGIEAWGGARRDDNATADNPIDTQEEKDEAASLKAADVAAPSRGSLRSMLIPDHEDDLLLTCDFEQLQLWLYAKQFNVKWLLEVFESREYIYGVVYEKLYKEPFFQPGKPRTKKYKLQISEQRMRRAKAVPLGFLFGRSAEAVAKEYDWTLEEGQKLRRWWFDLNPELEKSYTQIKYQIQQKGYIRHCFGQIIHYPSLKLTEAINSHAQSPEAFVVSGSMILIDKELKRRQYQNTRILLQIHDSITLNIGGAKKRPEHLIEVAEEIVFPILGRPLPQLGNFQLRFSAEVSSMLDWEVTPYNDWKVNVGNCNDVSASA